MRRKSMRPVSSRRASNPPKADHSILIKTSGEAYFSRKREPLATHCDQPSGVGFCWYSVKSAVHCSRLSKLVFNTTKQPWGVAFELAYQAAACHEGRPVHGT